jgi:mannose-6-phosphate isomerase-like protein (cupin superfamily)/GNAT superfamily N-acetyltransferase
MQIRDLGPGDREWLRTLIEGRWGVPVVSISGRYDPTEFPGFVAEEDSRRLGALTYRADSYGIEIVTLDSLVENRGVGSALLEHAKKLAREAGTQLWLITTNDNIRAIRFYQRRGMELVGLHRDFDQIVRRVKPAVDAVGSEGIRFHHALRFEFRSETIPRSTQKETGPRVPDKVSLAAKLATFDEHWSPRIVGYMNDYKLQVVRVKGEFVWHTHPETDDFFLVLKGRMAVQLRDRTVELEAGEMFVVPRGVEHRTSATEESHILLIEPVGTPNTGSTGGNLTAEECEV